MIIKRSQKASLQLSSSTDWQLQSMTRAHSKIAFSLDKSSTRHNIVSRYRLLFNARNNLTKLQDDSKKKSIKGILSQNTVYHDINENNNNPGFPDLWKAIDKYSKRKHIRPPTDQSQQCLEPLLQITGSINIWLSTLLPTQALSTCLRFQKLRVTN